MRLQEISLLKLLHLALKGAVFSVSHARCVPLFFFQSQKGNESNLGSVDFYPGNGTFDLMYYPYYGKMTHVRTDSGISAVSPWEGEDRAAAQSPDVFSGYFGQMRAGERPWALGLQCSISVSGKPQETLGDGSSLLPAMGMITFILWRPREGLNTGVFPGC